MGRPKGWTTAVTGRPAQRVQGHPGLRREHRQAFWAAIARGLTTEDASAEVGISKPAGARLFSQGGGMPTVTQLPMSHRFLSFAEREDIAMHRASGCGVREIARMTKRSPATISRELRRNAATRQGRLAYRASTAQWHADNRARRPKIAKLAANGQLQAYVQERLSGAVRRPDGTIIPGPHAPWHKKSTRRRYRDRRWALSWSPEQISRRLVVDFPNDESMRISHEAIYQALYVQGRGALNRQLTECLRTGRALRVPRARTERRKKAYVTDEIMISERPQEVEDRAVPGHWEGDLIVGLNSSAIGTLVERTTRFTMLLHLPHMEGHLEGLHTRHGPPLAGPRCRGCARRDHSDDHDAPRTTASHADVGPGRRDDPARQAARRHRRRGVLLRPAQPLAARHQREHERAASPVLPKGDEPRPLRQRRAHRSGHGTQRSTEEDAQLEDASRGSRRVSTILRTGRCCEDPLNSRNSTISDWRLMP